LLLPWQDGARWFWDTLVDADLANNTLGWQWAAGCGADAAPYFRIFNPVLQATKFDPEGLYVKKWLPALRGISVPDVHKVFDLPPLVLARAGVTLGKDYPAPVVDHGKARDAALEAYARLKG
jgi:deoxyribodipyrimidine photo-lyase